VVHGLRRYSYFCHLVDLRFSLSVISTKRSPVAIRSALQDKRMERWFDGAHHRSALRCRRVKNQYSCIALYRDDEVISGAGLCPIACSALL